jgi:hypothetical protein
MNLAQIAGQAALNAITALLNGGTLVMYSGSQPASPETGLSGNTALATFTFSGTAFSAASISGGYAVGNASFVSNSVLPTAGGNVTFCRLYKSDGTTAVMDASIGTNGTDIVIANVSLTTSINVSITSLVAKIPVS